MTCRCSSTEEHLARARRYDDEREREQAATQKKVTDDLRWCRPQWAEMQEDYAKRQAELDARTPRADQFEIEDVHEDRGYLVLRVKYPNCAKCAFEGIKTIVFQGVTLKDVLKWKRIDPHFRAFVNNTAKDAPPPIARFPGSPDGYAHAVAYVAIIADGKLPALKKPLVR